MINNVVIISDVQQSDSVTHCVYLKKFKKNFFVLLYLGATL